MHSEWFKVGKKVWFMGFGPAVEIISIDNGDTSLDYESGSWVGRDDEGRRLTYPLDEVKTYWQQYCYKKA